MNARIAFAAALLIAAAPSSARSGCCLADPGGLDLDPTAVPLLVMRDVPSGELVLTWESPARADTQVWQGDLDALWADGFLVDSVVADTADSEWRVGLPVGGAYFLISGSCNGLVCTRGRDSSGEERIEPGSQIVARGEIYSDAAACLVGGEGIVRDMSEYAAFASCFMFSDPPPPPEPGLVLVWATDYSNAACGTCLEFTRAGGITNELVVERKGQPWGDCDAIHHGGAWALVPAAPIITLVEEMPPFPEYGICD